MTSKNLFITGLILIHSCFILAQGTKLIVKKVHGKVIEKYYVLKSDKTILHGEYTSFHPMSDTDAVHIKHGIAKEEYFVKEKGYYRNGQKDSLWREYGTPKKTPSEDTYGIGRGVLLTKGKYKSDKKIGIWLTYKGEVTERYDFDNNIQLKPIVNIDIIYPDNAKTKKIEGSVKVRFKIHSDCSITDIEIIKSLSKDCDEAVINGINRYAELLKTHVKECDEKEEEQEIDFFLD
jgi:TonB family protein